MQHRRARILDPGSLAFLIVAALTLPTAPASAAMRSFAAGSLIIPMDWCYQTHADNALVAAAPAYCVHPTHDRNGLDGVYLGYGLAFRLAKLGVPVYVIVNPAKTAPGDVDLTVHAAAGTPVTVLDNATGAVAEFFAPDTTIDYRGMPLIIDAPDAANAMALLRTDPVLSTGNPSIQGGVVVHVAKQGFQAPVSQTLTRAPKIAVFNFPGTDLGVLQAYLQKCGLWHGGAAQGVQPGPAGEVFDRFDNPADIINGALLAGHYDVLWTTFWTGSGQPQTNDVYTAVNAFLDAGHGLFAQDTSITTQEGRYDGAVSLQNADTAFTARYTLTAGLNSAGPASHPSAPGDGWQFGEPANPLTQIGDFGLQTVTGSPTLWKPNLATNSVWRTGLVPLVRTSSATAANDDWVLETVIRKDDDPKRGGILYLGGHDWSGQVAGVRLVLNGLILFAPQASAEQELGRSAPIVDAGGNVFQGTYVAASSAAASYPPVAGHFRMYAAAAVDGAQVTSFAGVTPMWDAATLLPSGGTRTVLTAVPAGGSFVQTSFTPANATALAAPLGVAPASAASTIAAIRGGRLGGIDHSTPAIVGPSNVAGSATRPTVAYVGGLDGMLHAIAVSGAPVPAGTEMWAFIPPSQLGKIAGYLAGVDGSPAVADVFIPDAEGKRSWHTILTIPCGAFGGTLTAIDVTDPTQPAFLWEAAASGTAYAMGAARGAAIGRVAQQGAPRSLVYIATNNMGAAGNGINVYALDAGTGQVVSQFNHTYSRHILGTAMLTPNDVPGVPAVVSLAGDGSFDDHVYVGDLDGRLWELGAQLDASPPTVPLYDTGSDGHPIANSVALYRDRVTQHLAVVGATGGADWVPATVTSIVFGVDVEQRQGGAGLVLFQSLLAPGEHVYAAPTVAGNDVYLVTAFGKLNEAVSATTGDAGNLRRINLSGGTITATTALTKGAGEAAVGPAGNVLVTSVGGLSSVANGGRDGEALALNYRPQPPLIVLAWLDLL